MDELGTLESIKILQNGVEIYLTKLTAKELSYLWNSGMLKVEKYQREEDESYQREEDVNKISGLAGFLIEYKNDKVVKAILPASVILNAPDRRDIGFDEKDQHKIIIKKGAKLNIVDGQHRIKGLIKALEQNKNLDFELPVSIVTNLERFQEAAQFLVINVKQKQVRTDLSLTVLHDMEKKKTADFINRLKKVLDVDSWQLDATHIAIELNNNNSSPLNDLILRPNENRKRLKEIGRPWTPITQASLVDDLHFFCSPNTGSGKTDLDSKTNFMIKFWSGIKHYVYESAFDSEVGKNYMLLKGNGVGPLNILATFFYSLDKSGVILLEKAIRRLGEEYPLESWDKNGPHGEWGTSQKEFEKNGLDLIKKIFPSFDYFDSNKYKELLDEDIVPERILKAAEDILSPSNLISKGDLPENPESGCYALISMKDEGENVKVYVGQTVTVKDRLKSHSRGFRLYAFKKYKDESLDILEATLYHLVKSTHRINDVHPPKTSKKCPICEFEKSKK